MNNNGRVAISACVFFPAETEGMQGAQKSRDVLVEPKLMPVSTVNRHVLAVSTVGATGYSKRAVSWSLAQCCRAADRPGRCGVFVKFDEVVLCA